MKIYQVVETICDDDGCVEFVKGTFLDEDKAKQLVEKLKTEWVDTKGKANECSYCPYDTYVEDYIQEARKKCDRFMQYADGYCLGFDDSACYEDREYMVREHEVIE